MSGKDIFDAIAKSKGRKPLKRGAQEEAVLPFSAAAKKEAAAVPPPAPGEAMPDGSIYLGVYAPLNRRGKPLGKSFSVYAAPESLSGAFSFNSARMSVRLTKNWLGHDGADYRSDRAFYRALKRGKYNGGWVIPPLEILSGKNEHNGAAMKDNLLAHRNTGAFAPPRGAGYAGLQTHVSCTIVYEDFGDRYLFYRRAVNVYFSPYSGGKKLNVHVGQGLSENVRFVRLEEIKP